MNKLFGYARVSTEAQNLAMQISALKTFGVEEVNIYAEKESGRKTERKELEKLLMVLREGDLIVFYDLSRVGRDFNHLCSLVAIFEKQGINFKDISNPIIDTTNYQTPEGKLIFRLFASIYSFFVEQSNEKVRKGIKASKDNGTYKGGRPKGMSKGLQNKTSRVVKFYTETSMTNEEICETLNMAPASMYKCLKSEGIDTKIDRNRKRKNAA